MLSFTKNKLIRLLLPLLTALVILFALKQSRSVDGSTEQDEFHEEFGPVMGTSGEVLIFSSKTQKLPSSEAFTQAYATIKHVESLLSRFNPGSDISKINHAAAGEKVQVDPITWQVLLEARRFFQLTAGAFDPAIGSLISLYPWKNKEFEALPEPGAIAEALRHSGFAKLEFIRDGMYVRKRDSELQLDLGAIAKGFGVRAMADSLRKNGVTSAVINIGGEIEFIGTPKLKSSIKQTIGSSTTHWETKIKNPRGDGEILSLVTPADRAVATSGDYEKYFTINGKKYSHIINPLTGYPLSGGIISATVITSRSCTIADGLATSISVIGVDKARKLLELFPDTTAYLILADMSKLTLEGGMQVQSEDEVGVE